MRPLTDEEGEVRELTEEDLAEMSPIVEVDPGMLEAIEELRRKLGRPRSVSPKVHIGFRLAADVVEGIKATGKGYNVRVEAALREALEKGRLKSDQAKISIIAWSGPGAPAPSTFPVTKGLTSSAIREKSPVVVGDVHSDPRYLTAFGSTLAEIIIPLWIRGIRASSAQLTWRARRRMHFPRRIKSAWSEARAPRSRFGLMLDPAHGFARRRLALLILFLWFPLRAHAAQAPDAAVAGFTAGSYRSPSGEAMAYRLFAPPDYDTAKKYSIVLWLHGAAGRGADNFSQLAGGNTAGSRASGPRRKTIWVVFNKAKSTNQIRQDWRKGCRRTVRELPRN